MGAQLAHDNKSKSTTFKERIATLRLYSTRRGIGDLTLSTHFAAAPGPGLPFKATVSG